MEIAGNAASTLSSIVEDNKKESKPNSKEEKSVNELLSDFMKHQIPKYLEEQKKKGNQNELYQAL